MSGDRNDESEAGPGDGETPRIDPRGATHAASRPRSESTARLHDNVRAALFEGRSTGSDYTPGTVLAGRYRITSLIGRGGMGEVYRAYDTVLGDDVALKFLPHRYATNEALMQRFVGEVRIARQITHPNVCRVHDIGEGDDRRFLSMEFIDGEDLSSLLRRIGRLPQEKAFELGQQLCAGLAALHDQGVLHRDLKPSNVLIDGRGKLKLVDFGLAALADEVSEDSLRDGTPAYMAPEQARGEAVTRRSDIYALGLVLYELVTGRHARSGESGGAVTSVDSAARPASQHVRGLPREFDDVVAACLDPEPDARPPSVMAVAAALPGGDPVAAAIAAGRAPSVEAIARAGSTGTLPVRFAYAIAAAITVMVVGFAIVSGRMSVLGQAELELSPDVLRQRAIEVLERVGVDPELGDEYVDLSLEPAMWDVRHSGDPARAREFTPDGPAPLLLYLRRSPAEFHSLGTEVGRSDPPLEHPHEVRAAIDGRGWLRELLVVPPEHPPERVGDASPDWSVLLTAAGLDAAEVVAIEPGLTPRFAADRQWAWRGTQASTATPVVVEAAAYRGIPVSFVVLPPWDRRVKPDDAERSQQTLGAVPIAIVIVILGVVVWLARRNILRGEADLRGALRVALAVTMLHAVALSLAGHYSSLPRAFYLFVAGSGEALFYGVLTFAFYVLVEPLCRRFLPRAMIGWTRLVRGQWRDRLVARDVLLGLGAGVFLACVTLAATLAMKPLVHLGVREAEVLLGGRFVVADLASGMWVAVFGVLQVFILFLLLRIALRGPRTAAFALAILWSLASFFGFAYELDARDFAIAVALALVVAVTLVFVIYRLGLLAAVTMQTGLNLCYLLPITTDLSAWHSGTGLVGLSCLAALLVFGLRCAPPKSGQRALSV